MPPRPLVVHVEEPESGGAWDYVVEASPAIVGRGDDAAVQIVRPFVSLHHGTFDFDDGEVRYSDLDSRNGTLIDGVARGVDRAVAVTETTDLRIGKVRLRISREVPVKPAGAEPANPFLPKGKSQGAQKGTDALPREELDRIRREVMAPRIEPKPAAPAVVAAPAPPLMEKTVPVPLPPTPMVRAEPAPAIRSPYNPGGTRAVPMPARTPTPRPPRRTTGSRAVSEGAGGKRKASPRPVKRRAWLPIAFVAAVLSAAAIVLLISEVDRPQRRRPDPIPQPIHGDPLPVPVPEPPAPAATPPVPVVPVAPVAPPVRPHPTVRPVTPVHAAPHAPAAPAKPSIPILP